MYDIFNADCLELMDLMIPDKSVDLVLTDPPYLIDYKTGHRKDKTHKFCSTIENDNNPTFIAKALTSIAKTMKDESAIYLFMSSAKMSFFITEMEKHFKIKNVIIWVKNNWTAGDLKGAYGKQYEMCIYAVKGHPPIRGKRLTDVWNFKRVAGKELIHQNQKPLDLISLMIEKSSDEGQVVFDPFMGSGTTGVACKNLNRSFIGIEKDPEYFKLAERRING